MRLEGCTARTRRQCRPRSSFQVTTEALTVAVPCTSTDGGDSSPLPVGLEYSSDTRGSRRMFAALAGKPIAVVSSTCPRSGSSRGTAGQASGVPSRPSVATSHVTKPARTACTSEGRSSTVATALPMGSIGSWYPMAARPPYLRGPGWSGGPRSARPAGGRPLSQSSSSTQSKVLVTAFFHLR